MTLSAVGQAGVCNLRHEVSQIARISYRAFNALICD